MSMYYNSLDTECEAGRDGLNKVRVETLREKAVTERNRPNNIFVPHSSNKCTGERMRGKRIATLMQLMGYKVQFDGLQETKGGKYLLQFTVNVPGQWYTYYADNVEECERKYRDKVV